MRMPRWTTILVMLAVACEPGTGTVVGGDASADPSPDVTTAADMPAQPDASLDAGGVDADPRPDVSSMDAMMTDADVVVVPPGPQRVWTGEVDGTIAWWTFDPADGSFTREGGLERGGTLNFLATAADGSRLYAIVGSRVEAFDITSLPPTFLGDADAGVSGNGTHLAVDATRSHVFVAWYGGDAVSMLPLDADGLPSDATVVLGGGADPTFCENAHQIRVHPNNDFVYAPCLGSDHVVGMAYDSDAGTLVEVGPYATPGGSGPRHMDFHPSLPQAYVIGELGNNIIRYSVDGTSGEMSLIDEVTTLQDAADPFSPCSDIHVSHDGNWVVGINRSITAGGLDQVVSYALAADGAMSNGSWVSTGGVHARTFTITEGDDYLLVGNSNSNDVTVFGFANGTATQQQIVGAPFDDRVMFVGIE